MKSIITYAQNREDLFIASYFPDVEEGFYVDIGAFDPVHDSVTKFFYDRKWRGINVEPQPAHFKKFMKDRPGDINLNVGVSDKKGKLKLREYSGGGFSTFSEKVKQDYDNQAAMKNVPYKDYEVGVTTLKDLHKSYIKGKHVHYVKIDVEGLEYEVLSGNDWSTFRPELICIESNHMVKDWTGILKEAKYKKVFFDGLNEYYLAHESSQREKLFCYPKKFLATGAVMHYDAAWQLDAMKKQLKDLYSRISELDHAVAKANHWEQSYRELEEKYKKLHEIKTSVKHTLRVVKNNTSKRVKTKLQKGIK